MLGDVPARLAVGDRPRRGQAHRTPRPGPGIDDKRLRLLLRDIFRADGGTHIQPSGVIGDARLRPGNATANNVADQLKVIDETIAALPSVWRAGHTEGDQTWRVKRRLVIRDHTAACSNKMLAGLADRNLVFSVGLRGSDASAAVIAGFEDGMWTRGIDTAERPPPSAVVTEIDALVPD